MPPQSLPVLSRGRHRSPRRGACFMELASILAGERWSDHPRCTHPVLAALARAVNDTTADAARHRLAPLVPDVIGTDADAPAVAPALVELACREALRHVGDVRRTALAVGLLGAEQRRAAEAPDVGPSDDGDDPLSPAERLLAARFVGSLRTVSAATYRKRAPALVEQAVAVAADPPTTWTDDERRALLARAVEHYHRLVPEVAPAVVGEGSWRSACSRVGVVRG